MLVRRVALGGLSGAMLVLVALVALALFVQFPMVMTTGDAHLQRWIGPDAARLSFFGLALVVGGGAIWVAWQGTLDVAARPAWRLGATTGGIAGLVTAVLFVVVAGVATSSAESQV